MRGRGDLALPDDDGFLELHDLSPEALVHWDRDMAEVVGAGEFELHTGLEDFQTNAAPYAWDYIVWIPCYCSGPVSCHIHTRHGWIRWDGRSGEGTFMAAWHVSWALSIFKGP